LKILINKALIISVLIILTSIILFTSTLSAQTHQTSDDYVSAGKIYLSLDVAFFMPVTTVSLRINVRVRDYIGWGIGLNYFFVAGWNINVEPFIKFSPINTKYYEFPISVGFIVGGGKEASLGLTPRNMFGIGLHILLEPAVIKTKYVGVSLLNLGLQFITNFDAFAFSLYVGNGARFYFEKENEA
jgi:hypothetical protein